MMTLGTMELERELTGEIQPNRNFLFFSRRRVGIRQTLKHLPVDELTKEISLHRFSHMFQVMDLATAKSLQHARTIVFQAQQIHHVFRFREAGVGGASRMACSSGLRTSRSCRGSLTTRAR